MTTNANGTEAGASPDTTLAAIRSMMAGELRSLTTSELLDRYQFARGYGMTFSGKRDLYQVLGYETVLTAADYRQRYERGGIAGSIIDVLPDATWRGEGELIEDEDPKTDTPFEAAWRALDQRLGLWPRMCRADKLARLSTYSVLILGTGDDLRSELPRAKKPDGSGLLFVDPYCGAGGWRMSGTRAARRGGMARAALDDEGAEITIAEWDEDRTSPRYGRPKTYRLRRDTVMGVRGNQDVHWSRVTHIAENPLDDDVFGQPVLARIWNLLDDLDKVSGGGAEAFWQRANKGLQVDIDKGVQSLGEAEKNDLRDQVERYVHEMTRVLRTRGVTIKELGSDVANYSNPGDFTLTLIAGSVRIPKRILTGSEMGELASSQDRENFRDQVIGRQLGHAGPNIVRNLVDRLIAYGYLPTPTKPYRVAWPHTQVLTEAERAEGAARWAAINAQAVSATGEVVFTNDEIREKWYGLAPLKRAARRPAVAPQAPASGEGA